MRPLSYYAAWRDRAAKQGDMGLARALSADLARHGWVDPPASLPEEEPQRRGPGRPRKETARHEAPERAIEPE